jgi:hypothetical protein
MAKGLFDNRVVSMQGLPNALVTKLLLLDDED